ncbi:RTA1 like protein-domain-containing protein [Mycena capillaripes]|nr:RTA1 like protein-domain-containing protein [Mycena capillaripes]
MFTPFVPGPALTLLRFDFRDDTTVSDDDLYGYVPQEAIAILFLSLYGISTSSLHIAQATYFRMWWLLPTVVLCGYGELIGWSARLWSSDSPILFTPFAMELISKMGIGFAPQSSRRPLTGREFRDFFASRSTTGHTILMAPAQVVHVALPALRVFLQLVFVLCRTQFVVQDIIALAVQGVGAGIASSATDLAGANRGARIMLGGIGFQFAMALDFMQRYLRDRPAGTDSNPSGMLTPRRKIMLSALAFSTTTLFIRSVYRMIELTGGWEGRIIRTEVYFNVLDGGMVVLAIFTLNFAHPGVLLQNPSLRANVETIKLQSADNLRAVA